MEFLSATKTAGRRSNEVRNLSCEATTVSELANSMSVMAVTRLVSFSLQPPMWALTSCCLVGIPEVWKENSDKIAMSMWSRVFVIKIRKLRGEEK